MKLSIAIRSTIATMASVSFFVGVVDAQEVNVRRRLHHCSYPSPTAATTDLASPSNGNTVTVSGSITGHDDLDLYSMEAFAGCSYTFSFCPEDEVVTGFSGNIPGTAPWAQVISP